MQCSEGGTYTPPLGSGISQVSSPSGQPPLTSGFEHTLDVPSMCQQAPGGLDLGWGICLQALPSRSQPPALSQLVSLYLGRSHFLWKEPAIMSWLEENVREVLQAVDAGDPAVEECENR